MVHRGAARDRRARHRRDAAAARGDAGLGDGPRAGRRPALGPPGRRVPARRLGGRRRRRAAARARGRAARRRGRRPQDRAREGVDGQAVRERGGVPLRRPRGAGVRRPRLPARQRGRALPARAARGPDLGGHQRDPAADRRPLARAPRRGGGARADAPPTARGGRSVRGASTSRRCCGRAPSRSSARPTGPGSYGDATLRNLAALGFAGPVWGVHPTRRRCTGGRACRRSRTCPSRSTRVVVAIPAAGVPEVVRAAGAARLRRRGRLRGGVRGGRRRRAAGRAAPRPPRRGLPVLGPNCDGLVAFHAGAALWGDALVAAAGRAASRSSRRAGTWPSTRWRVGRGLRFHTVASVGNQAVLDAATLLEALVEDEDVGSVALFLESDGDGARLAGRSRGRPSAAIGVAVLKVGATAAGATAAAAHTGALAGRPAGLPRARRGGGRRVGGRRARPARAGQGAGGAGARARPAGGAAAAAGSRSSPARAATRGSRPTRRAGSGSRCRRSPPRPPRALEPLLPAGGDDRQPARLHGDDLGRARAARGDRARRSPTDPAVDQLLLFYDEPAGLDAALQASWDAVRDGLADGAGRRGRGGARRLDAARAAPGRLAPRPTSSAACPRSPGCAPRWRSPPRSAARPATRRGCARSPARPRGAGGAGRLAREAEAKALLRAPGWRCPRARWPRTRTTRSGSPRALGGPVAVKASSPALQHKTRGGRARARRRRARTAVARGLPRGVARPPPAAGGGRVLVEAMAAPGVELVVAARRDAVVPALVVGPRRDLDRAARRRRGRPAAGDAGAGRGGAARRCAAPACSPARAGGRAVDLDALAAARRRRGRPPARRGARPARAQPGDRRARRRGRGRRGRPPLGLTAPASARRVGRAHDVEERLAAGVAGELLAGERERALVRGRRCRRRRAA